MEFLPRDSILKFNPNTLEDVRKELNLDKPGRVDEAIDLLEDWVKKQAHFKKKNFSRNYLEITLVSCKGSVERTKKRIDKLCTFKTLIPHFFKISDSAELAELHKCVAHAHLPRMTPDNYRVYMANIIKSDNIDIALLFTHFKYICMISEYLKMYEYTKGYIVILDFSKANILSLLPRVDLLELRQAILLWTEGYGMRLKSLHIITPSKVMSAIVILLKQILNEKMISRVFNHKSIETLYEHVPANLLPEEYDGEQPPLKKLNEDWMKIICSEEYLEYLREMNEAGTIESNRQIDKFNEQYIGMPGSFRTLNVD